MFQILQHALLRHTSVASTHHFAKASFRYKDHSLSAENASIRQKKRNFVKNCHFAKILGVHFVPQRKAKRFGFHFFMKSQIRHFGFLFFWDLESTILAVTFLKENPKIQIQSKSDDLPTLGQKKCHLPRRFSAHRTVNKWDSNAFWRTDIFLTKLRFFDQVTLFWPSDAFSGAEKEWLLWRSDAYTFHNDTRRKFLLSLKAMVWIAKT